jgi:hypothetical protein
MFEDFDDIQANVFNHIILDSKFMSICSGNTRFIRFTIFASRPDAKRHRPLLLTAAS